MESDFPHPGTKLSGSSCPENVPDHANDDLHHLFHNAIFDTVFTSENLTITLSLSGKARALYGYLCTKEAS
jgi:hypothetical protein